MNSLKQSPAWKLAKGKLVDPLRRLTFETVYRGHLPLYYCESPNWGDALSPILCAMLSGKPVKKMLWGHQNRFLVIGSILGSANEHAEVWGSGFIRENEGIIGRPRKVHAVRGPLSRKNLLKLGVDCPEVYGDPALLLPRIYNPDVPKRYEIGLIPHYADKSHPWLDRYRNDPNVSIIDVENDTYRFVQEVKSCELIVSSSLHGVICADSYGVPAIWMELSDNVIGNGFKFFDYFASIQREVPAPVVPHENMSLADVVSRHQPYRVQIDLDRLLLACPFLCSKERNRLIGKSRVG